MSNEDYSKSVEKRCEDSGILEGTYHDITLPAGIPPLPAGTRLSRKSTPSILLAKDERTRAYYRLVEQDGNKTWVLDD